MWFDEHGERLHSADWDNPVARLLGVRRLQVRGDRVEIAMLLFNADIAEHAFVLPPPVPGLRVLFDTFDPLGEERPVAGGRYPLAAGCMALLAAEVDRESALKWNGAGEQPAENGR
jgi:hypothetical protein